MRLLHLFPLPYVDLSKVQTQNAIHFQKDVGQGESSCFVQTFRPSFLEATTAFRSMSAGEGQETWLVVPGSGL